MSYRLLLLMVAFTTCVGCTGGDGFIAVGGTVTFQGAPLNEGSISFLPTDGKTPTAGAEIKAGKYTARVPKGTMKVTISASKKVGERKAYDTPDSPLVPIFAEVIPPQYNEQSTLTLDVGSTPIEKNWDLQ